MTFTIVNENDLKLSVVELAAILDLEIKSETPEQQYKTIFKQLLDGNKTDELTQQLIDIQPLFVTKLSRKSFEPTVNLYIHITKLLENSELLTTLISNIYPSETQLPTDVIFIALTNIFNSLPKTSIQRFESLKVIVNIMSNENISGLISNIAKHTEEWLSVIESISIDQTSEIVSLIFSRYVAEDETNAIKFFQDLVVNQKLQFNNTALITLYTTILNSGSIFDISKLQNNFESVGNASLTKALNLYLVGDYKSFVASKSELQSISGLNIENLESSLQSLAILNLLALSKSASVNYNDLAAELNIPAEEVEVKIITLISEGFVAAKLSQSTNSVIVNAVNFSAPSLSNKSELVNWSEINTLLGSWNENINNLQSTLQNLISKRGKRVNAPSVIMNFHQQKLEAKEAREKKAQQTQDVEVDA